MRFLLVCTCALTASLTVSPCSAAGAAATRPGSVRATTISGNTIEGIWAGVGEGGALQIRTDSGEMVSIAPDEAMGLYLGGSAATQPSGEGFTFFLSDGSRFSGRIVAGGARQVALTTTLVDRIEIPFSHLSAVRFGPAGGKGEEAFAGAVTERSPDQDVLVSVGGGRVTPIRGATQELTAEGGWFLWRDRRVPIRMDTVYGIVFARGVRPPEQAAARCYLRDGSIWAGRLTGGDAATIELQTQIGPTLRLAVTDVVEVRFHSDRVVLLSDLEPAEYHFEPFAVTQWPYRRDRSVANGPLRLGGQTFDRGIGMHARSRLVYELTEPYRELAATIGIDDAVRPRGSVVFRVVADGREVFNSGLVSGTDEPRPILVPLNGAKRLELHVDFGDGLDLADHADWAQVRLIK